jgi:hypothetical protein
MYKIKEWWYLLGLILLGSAFVKSFSFLPFFLGFFLLSFAHAWNDKKYWLSLVYWFFVVLFSLLVPSAQALIAHTTVFLSIIYDMAQRYPISAFYKGLGWGLLFLLPIGYFTLAYIPISLLASFSEIIHEANHFDEDKEEGRLTTAHLLNLKVSKEPGGGGEYS